MPIGRFVDTRTEAVAIRTRRLPHWTADGAIYFVTMRLADSLPRAVLEALQKIGDEKQRRKYAEIELDKHFGSCVLRNPDAAKCVLDAFRHFDGDRYNLGAACVMPNHAHILYSPIEPHTLSTTGHSLKSYTGTEINRILGRQGRLWEPESFDHLVRSGESYGGFVRYILDNPPKAGLKDWPWVHVAPAEGEK